MIKTHLFSWTGKQTVLHSICFLTVASAIFAIFQQLSAQEHNL